MLFVHKTLTHANAYSHDLWFSSKNIIPCKWGSNHFCRPHFSPPKIWLHVHERKVGSNLHRVSSANSRGHVNGYSHPLKFSHSKNVPLVNVDSHHPLFSPSNSSFHANGGGNLCAPTEIFASEKWTLCECLFASLCVFIVKIEPRVNGHLHASSFFPIRMPLDF